MYELDEEEEKRLSLKKGRHNSFVLVKMRLFHPQDNKMPSNSDLFLDLLNTDERKWSTGGSHGFVKCSQMFEV